MKKNAMRRNLRQSILRSFGRYIAISAIIALGAALFIGLLMTKTDMVATGQKYITEQNMFDLRMVSNYGWTEEYIAEFEKMEGIRDVEGMVYLDFVAKVGQQDDAVYRFYSMPKKINQVSLRGGRMPEHANECVIDGYNLDDSILGTKVQISQANDEDDLLDIRFKTYTVVGYVASPLYMDMNRGTTSIGSGSLTNIFYVPSGAFHTDYYSEINLTIEGEHQIYTPAYSDKLDEIVDRIEPDAEILAERRYQELKDEIEEEYNEGYQEYLDGLEDYQEGKAEAEQELADAEQELLDGEKELEENYQKLIDAGNEIDAGFKAVDEGWVQWDQARRALEAQKPVALAEISAARAKLDQAKPMIDAGYAQATGAIQAAKEALATAQATGDATAIATAAAALQAVNSDPDIQKALQAKAASDTGYQTIAGKEQELAYAEQQISIQEAVLNNTLDQLNNAYSKLMINWGLWGEGRDEIKEGWVEYEDAKKEVEEEFAEAEADLKEAEMELADAREEIDSMDEPDLIILDRESNVGYNNLDSSSDIVQGVSRVFPVFFLLIASLVCITTMTRMIDEERTQIGTLKALGYSNSEIISKYLIYSGSGAILGCSMGMLLGCTIFPQVIWQAYNIMLYIQPDVVLTVDWPLGITVLVSYLSVMLLVTWYCCNKTLKEEPAELIRPKAPDAGKKIWLESLPVWQKLSFLNKVAIRNIFRYRQRLAMMLIGIGGCTALLIAGFGLRDSIVTVVDYQFEEVTLYDLSVYFRDALTEREQEKFEEAIDGKADHYMLYHQSSVDLDFHGRVKEIYMISGDDQLTEFIDVHIGQTPISLPQAGQVVLSAGVAENLGIHNGDHVILRNADMEEMSLEVSGIYDNHVYNYALVAPSSIQSAWGESPELQMAFVSIPEGENVHTVSAAITELDTVLNVSVSEDLADMVGNMMEALDLVIVVVVLCAALLAIIVLYNLTNININERIREIATIKVLGFNASETAAYVFKENMVLTVVGSIFGLGLGRLLLEFIMSQVKIDMVWFKALLSPVSCVLAVVLTLLAAVAVVFIFYFKLEKINMAEALKSVE